MLDIHLWVCPTGNVTTVEIIVDSTTTCPGNGQLDPQQRRN
jgi:hypothetical protein